MKQMIKQLWLAVSLILAASVLLLLSDLGQRRSGRKQAERSWPRIAIMQVASTTLLDNHVNGVIERLSSEGYVAPGQDNIRIFNPQGDMPTANAIAREIANGPYDLVITSSTLAMQTFAKANQRTGKIHIFGAVTDPYTAGIGISGPRPDQHPPYMAGVGSFQPVKKTFRILRTLNPSIKRVGVVHNPGEQCSEACLKQARAICSELDIDLVDAVAGNTSEVSDAITAVLSRNVQAVWIGGDNVAISAIATIISKSRQQGVPVFTNDPSDVGAGALFGLGADYYTVGKYTADLAITVLKGKSPAEIGIENVLPEALDVNRQVLASLGGNWSLPPDIAGMIVKKDDAAAVKTIDFAAAEWNEDSPGDQLILGADRFDNLHRHTGRPLRVAVINLVENTALENALAGFAEGLRTCGLVEDVDFVLKKYCAQGEIGQLPQIIGAALQDRPDLVVTCTTPAFIAAAKRIGDVPLVFTVASDPKKLNLWPGEIPKNICGIHDDPPVDQVLDMAISHHKGLRKAGIIYDAAQMNSLISVEKLRNAAKQRQVKVLEATASTASELPMAAQSLAQRGAQVFILSADNLAYTGFPAILRVARSAGIPIYTTENELMNQGADGAIGDDFYQWGFESGGMAAKVLAGAPPSLVGIRPTTKVVRIDPVDGRAGRLLRLRIVLYSETEFAERCYEGLIDGLAHAGFRENTDFELKSYNAQGDMSTLSSIMNTVKADHVDLLMVVSTPTLQAALRQAGTGTKIVFTGVGDGVKAGAGKSETDHLPNVTGISTRSPFGGMARLIKKMHPGVQKVGTLFTPGEINSVLYKDWFRAALAENGIGLVAVPVSSGAEVSQAAIELCRQDIQLIGQIVDNLTRPGFALIARRAADHNLPVFVFDSDQMPDGGAVCLARDYYDAGLEAADKAARVLRGEDPGSIPFNNTQSEKLIYNPDLIKKYGLIMPEEFRQNAVVYKKD